MTEEANRHSGTEIPVGESNAPDASRGFSFEFGNGGHCRLECRFVVREDCFDEVGIERKKRRPHGSGMKIGNPTLQGCD